MPVKTKTKQKTKIYSADITKTIYSKKIKIGTDFDKANVSLELNIKKVKKHYFKQTINHKKIRVFNTLSISGYAKRKYTHDWDYGGQIIDSLGPDNIKSYLVPKKIVDKIVYIWKNYHLNDMRPNCIHQKAFNCNVDNYEELAAIETAKCPKKYQYGSTWLVEIIPDKIINEIISIFENN